MFQVHSVRILHTYIVSIDDWLVISISISQGLVQFILFLQIRRDNLIHFLLLLFVVLFLSFILFYCFLHLLSVYGVFLNILPLSNSISWNWILL